MKVFVVTRKGLMAAASVVTSMLIISAVVLNMLGASGVRRLPIYSVETQEKQIALTFDAAWTADDTDTLIEILAKYSVPATFFVVGDWADRYPDAVKKFSDAGHDIMNHSNTHPHITDMDKEKFLEDVRACNEKIAAITGKQPVLYRGPYGEYNNTTVAAIEEEGMYYLQWDCDSRDWKPDFTVEKIVASATKNVQNGSILLMHNGAANTPQALPLIIEKLQGEGYTFVLAEKLIYKENYTIDHTGRQIAK
jgi:polysaccharide deacetylase family sporulation protein PdaB